VLRHALTHRDLLLHAVEQPWPLQGPTAPDAQGCWVTARAMLAELGLPVPVRNWLAEHLTA
jgi:hypothetical protein